MFRNRKRKVSPDKKSDKSKKLKVSSKIFRSPSSTKTNSEAKSKLGKLLPEGYDSIILTANTKPVESFEENEAVFGCVRLPILTKEDAMVWVKKFERKTYTSYRTQRTWKKDVNTGLFKRKYICNVRNKDVAGQAATTACKGSIIFTIKDQEEIQANPDYYLRDYPSQVIIHFCHNHKIDPYSYMKNLRPSAELRIIFGTYFAKGHSPFSALICHKCDLHSSYGAEFYNVVSNGAICPSYNWCFHEYEKFFMHKFIEPPEDKLNEKLKEALSQFNSKWRSECAVISYNPLLVLSICTPLMKSIFRSGFAEELITVRCFSTPKTVPKRQKLILFLCHTPIGSLPFGVVVTFAEDTDNVCEGITALIKMFGVTSYSPKTIIIDENALLSKALKRCFPKAQILFNEFQMLQSIWRINRVVCCEDDEEFQALYNLFLVTLNSSSEEEFKKNFDSLLVYAEKYPKLTNFLKYFKVRSNSYVLYARPKIEFNTDVLNYTDSGTIILQDVSIKYGNFFNILQLFDFLSKSYVDHYERKLNKIIEGDLKGFFKTNFYVPLSKIADFTCEKISDTEFLVSLNEMKFFVNAELDTCTCQVGVHGGSCVHQYIVEKNLGFVPECYTPLCDDMLGIFKNILREKNIKPPLPDSDRLSELGSALDSLKSELDTYTQDADDFSDIVSSVCCSEISNFSGMPHDMDHLGPLDEIFLAPPDINDSFTDITDEVMSPLVLSEFDDTNEDNEDFFDDSQQYNRESGELEPIESADSTGEKKEFQNNVLVEGFPVSLEHSIPTRGLFLNQDNTENVIIYEYTEDDIKCNNEVEIVEHCNAVEGDTLVHLPADGSIVLSTDVGYNITDNITCGESSVVYTYSSENQGQVEYYEDVMTENDRKTAEIAEFLTNLPDTNNSNLYLTTTKQGSHGANIVRRLGSEKNFEPKKMETLTHIGERRAAESEQTVSNGVVVVKNDEYFTNYKVLENNVLSVVTKGSDVFTNNVKQNISSPESYQDTSQQSAQSLITDTYEENNFIMMSPNDLFDDNQNVEADVTTDRQDGKINVLSSVVIKPPTFAPPTYTPNFPLNLNAIKHKTLRNVKEDSRSRMSEQRITKSENTIFVHDPLKSEPRKIVLPAVFKRESKNSCDLEKDKQSHEKDVIKLYCNQSGEKSLLEENKQKETKSFQQEVFSDEMPLKVEPAEENLVDPIQSEDDSQEFDKELAYTKIGSQECKQEITSSEVDLNEYEPRDDTQELNQDVAVPESGDNLQELDQDDLLSRDSRDDSQELNPDVSVSDPKDSSKELYQNVSVPEILSLTYDNNVSDSELILADCDPEELAKHDYVEIVEIDSDGLEELASQKYDSALLSCDVPLNPTYSQSLLPEKNLKLTPINTVPSKILPFKSFPIKNVPLRSNCISLRDFMSKISPSKVQLQQTFTSKVKGLEGASIKRNIAKALLPSVHDDTGLLEDNESLKKVRGKSNTMEKTDTYSVNESAAKSKMTRNVDPNVGENTKTTKHNIKNSSKPTGKMINKNKKAKLDFKGREKRLGSNIKQLKTIQDVHKSKQNCKERTLALKTFAAKKEQALITHKRIMDTSDSNETNLSDGEDLSDSFKFFSPGIDELSEDELYELQFLLDSNSSEESSDDFNVSRTDSKLSSKFNVKTLKKTDGSINLNPHYNDTSSDESVDHIKSSYKRNKRKGQPSKMKSAEIQKKKELSGNKMFNKPKNSNSKNLPFVDKSCHESFDSVSRKDVKSNLPPNLQTKKKSMDNYQKSTVLNIKSQEYQSDENALDILTNSDNMSGITCQPPPKPKLEIKPTVKNLESDKLSVITSTETKKHVLGSVTPSETNYNSNGDESGHVVNVLNEKKENLDQKSKHASSKKVEIFGKSDEASEQNHHLHTISSERDKKAEFVLVDQNNANVYPNQQSKGAINKSIQKINLKMLNIRNKKISNTTLKLDSLPNILSWPYQRVSGVHNKQVLNVNTDMILPNTERRAFEATNEIKISSDKKSTTQSANKNNLPAELKHKLSKCDISTSDQEEKLKTSKQGLLLIQRSDMDKTKGNLPAELKHKLSKCDISISDQEEKPKTSRQEGLLPIQRSDMDKTKDKQKDKKQINKKVSKQSPRTTNKPQGAKNILCSSLSLPDDSVSVKASKHFPETCLNPSIAGLTINETGGKIENKKDLTLQKFSVAPGRIPPCQKPITQIGKDIKDLEAILTSDKDFDRDIYSNANDKDAKSNTHSASIMQNNDLSFLFDDPRFETVVEEENALPTMLTAGVVPTTKNTAAGIHFSKINMPTIHFKNAPKKKSAKESSKREYSDIFNVSSSSKTELKINEEARSEKKAKCSQYGSTEQELNTKDTESNVQLLHHNTTSNDSQKIGLVQTDQNHVITFLVYTNAPNTLNKTVGKLIPNSTTKPLRKILPKPHINLSENNTEVFNFSNLGSYVASNLSLKQAHIEKPKTVVSIENRGHVYKKQYDNKCSDQSDTVLVQRASAAKSKTSNNTGRQSTEETSSTYNSRRSRSNSRAAKGTFVTENKNSEKLSDKAASRKKEEEASNTLRDLRTTKIDFLYPRRRSQSDTQLTKKVKESKKLDSSSEIGKSSKSVKTKGQSKVNLKNTITHTESKKSPSKKVQNDNSDKTLRSQSKIVERQTSLKKAKTTKNKTAVQKKVTVAKKAISNKKQSQHKDNDTKTKKDTKLSLHKINKSQEAKDKSLSSLYDSNASASLSKSNKTSLHEAPSTRSSASFKLDYESDDFENSIVASVLEKQQTPKKNLKCVETKNKRSVATSTPKKSIGYEDAFKIFLETSNKWHQNTEEDRSLSDFEKDIDDSDWEFDGQSRRRAKSVSSPTVQRSAINKDVSGKMKKSVSWAEGLNVIEYIQESDGDSYDSEIKVLPKKNKMSQKDKKCLKSSFSNKRDGHTSRQKYASFTKGVTRCTPEDSLARISTNVTDKKPSNRAILSTPVFEGRQRSLARTNDSMTVGKRLTRSRSSTPKRENIKVICKKRSRSCTSGKNFEPKLVILLEKNEEIDQRCRGLLNKTQTSLRCRRGGRIGYKELLHRARLSKEF